MKKAEKISRGYGHIPHLSGSKLGPGDHRIQPGQERILTEKTRDKYDRVIVQEKLDGSNVGIVNDNGVIRTVQRHGYPCESSPHENHQLFDYWVHHYIGDEVWLSRLHPGERMCGEWLMQAHGTLYRVERPWDLFYAFDIFNEKNERLIYSDFRRRLNSGAPFCRNAFYYSVPCASLMTGTFNGEACYGSCSRCDLESICGVGHPKPVNDMLQKLGAHGHHNCIGKPEGLVYRVERKGEVDFLAKYVNPEKITGRYLFETKIDESGNPVRTRASSPTWNFKPDALIDAIKRKIRKNQ